MKHKDEYFELVKKGSIEKFCPFCKSKKFFFAVKKETHVGYFVCEKCTKKWTHIIGVTDIREMK